MKSSRAFTLIEILVVIAIIGVLMALLFPAVQGALNTAKKSEAQNDVAQIATAIIAYQNEFGTWPVNAQPSAFSVNGQFLGALMSTNTRNITFLEVSPWKPGHGGVSNGAYMDPWTNTYQAVVDTTYQNSINVPSWSGVSTVQRTVGVWMQTNIIYNAQSGRIPPVSW